MSEQQNEIDNATTTLATKMVIWLSPLTQAVGQNIDLPLAAANSGGCDPVAGWMTGRTGARFAAGSSGAVTRAVEQACGQSTAHRGSLSACSQSQGSILPAIANVYQ